jgi:hypothetical protein
MLHILVMDMAECRWRCQYGPEDNRDKIQAITPEMTPTPMKYNHRGKLITSGLGQKGPRATDAKEGGSMKVGCQCRFYVKRYYFLPDIAEIAYFCTEHVDTHGFIVHDKDNMQRGKLRFRKCMSEEVRLWVLKQFDEQVPMAVIKQKHQKLVLIARDEGTLTPSRDCFLSMEDIRNICGVRAQELYKKHDSDAESVRMWVRENRHMVFYYRDLGTQVDGVLNADNVPFVIGIQTPFQTQMVLKYGHDNILAIDATFATNNKKVLTSIHMSI